MKLTDADIVALLPLFMRGDEANAALSRATNRLIREPGGRTKQLRVWDQIDELGHADLDELAWELDITWYDSTAPISVKRELIKNADKVHSKLGTKWAVWQVVKDYIGSCEIEEWFEYDGNPYCFRIQITKPIDDSFDLSKMRLLILNVLRVKNARSHLESVNYKLLPTILVNRNELLFRSFEAQGRFSNRGQMEPILLTGQRLLDGSWLLNQEWRGFIFPAFGAAMSVTTPERVNSSRIAFFLAPMLNATLGRFKSFRVDQKVQNAHTVKHKDLRLALRGVRQAYALSGSVTQDSVYNLDGSVLLDGSYKLNAQIIKEEI